MPVASLILAVIALSLVAAPSASAAVRPTTNIPIDGTPQLLHMPLLALPGASPGPALRTAAPRLRDGRAADLTLSLPDFANFTTHDVPFWKEYSGTHVDVYVGWDDLAAPPGSTQQDQTITTTAISYIGREFDRRIWPSDVFHFGSYKDRSPSPGANGSRVAVMIYNIRDDAYWGWSPFYVGGYFMGTLDDSAQLNAVFVDSFDWAHRTGPSGSEPYVVEGTLAHEFTHLIQWDVQPQQATFVQEGMAELAVQFLYGPKATSTEVGQYLYYHRDSLTDWKDELFDYGDAVLWQDYLWEQRGGRVLADPVGRPAPSRWRVKSGHSPLEDSARKFRDPGDRFIWQVAHDPGIGLQAFADQLAGGMQAVERYFRNWTLANLLDGHIADPRWNYRNLRLGGPDSDNLSIADGVAYYQSGGQVVSAPVTAKRVAAAAPAMTQRLGAVRATAATAPARAASVTPATPSCTPPPTVSPVTIPLTCEPWGAYYCTVMPPARRSTVSFAGTRAEGILPPTGTYEWWGGTGDYANHLLTRAISGVQPGDTLTFKTWFNIEQDFDFGYVEASTDGQTWTQLPQLSSLPASTENINQSDAADYEPGGLTGGSGGWQTAEYSLAGYAGTVYLRFRYATDVSTELEGWYIDDIAVDAAFADPCDTQNGWAADPADGWQLTTGITQNDDWTADVYLPHPGRWWSKVTPVVPVAGTGTSGNARVDTRSVKSGVVWGIVSNHPDNALSSHASLTFQKWR